MTAALLRDVVLVAIAMLLAFPLTVMVWLGDWPLVFLVLAGAELVARDVARWRP